MFRNTTEDHNNLFVPHPPELENKLALEHSIQTAFTYNRLNNRYSIKVLDLDIRLKSAQGISSSFKIITDIRLEKVFSSIDGPNCYLQITVTPVKVYFMLFRLLRLLVLGIKVLSL